MSSYFDYKDTSTLPVSAAGYESGNIGDCDAQKILKSENTPRIEPHPSIQMHTPEREAFCSQQEWRMVDQDSSRGSPTISLIIHKATPIMNAVADDKRSKEDDKTCADETLQKTRLKEDFTKGVQGAMLEPPAEDDFEDDFDAANDDLHKIVTPIGICAHKGAPTIAISSDILVTDRIITPSETLLPFPKSNEQSKSGIMNKRPTLNRSKRYLRLPLRTETIKITKAKQQDSDIASETSEETCSSSSSINSDTASCKKESRYKLGSPLSSWLQRVHKSPKPQSPSSLWSASGSYFSSETKLQTSKFDQDTTVLETVSSLPQKNTASQTSQNHTIKWTQEMLLEYTDETRFTLHQRVPTSIELATTFLVLSSLLEKEKSKSLHRTQLDTIAHTRLDKLLSDILQIEPSIDHSSSVKSILIVAHELLAEWKKRFGDRYDTLDEIRKHHMEKAGAFRDVVLNHSARSPVSLFIVARYNPRKKAEEIDFTPGDWWLNQACAYRDGITNSATQALNDDPGKGTTLMLTKGYEEQGSNEREFVYYGKGVNHEVPAVLVKCNKGQPIRLLRGFELDSEFAPRAGLRYDGLHIVKSFGHKYHKNANWTWRIVLEQVNPGPGVNSLFHIPRPSQLDDWHQYLAMIDVDRELKMEELCRFDESVNERQGEGWNEQVALLRASITVAFEEKEKVMSLC